MGVQWRQEVTLTETWKWCRRRRLYAFQVNSQGTQNGKAKSKRFLCISSGIQLIANCNPQVILDDLIQLLFLSTKCPYPSFNNSHNSGSIKVYSSGMSATTMGGRFCPQTVAGAVLYVWAACREWRPPKLHLWLRLGGEPGAGSRQRTDTWVLCRYICSAVRLRRLLREQRTRIFITVN